MKKLCSVILTLVLCLALFSPAMAVNAQPEGTYPAIATNNAIVVSNSTDEPDAHLVYPAVYKIDGANYFKLRDLAMLLNGSAKQFAVDYDAAAGAVSITTGKPYTAIGVELTGTAAESGSAIISNNTILIDGVSATLTVFKIDGANYFKLRDLGKALDFYVGYNDDMKTVTISGAKGYDTESDPDDIKATPIYKTAWINYSDDQRILENCLNAWTMAISSVRHLPIFKFDSKSELEAFMNDYADCFSFDQRYNDIPSFSETVAAYDEDFFAGNSLLCVYMVAGSGSFRFGVRDVQIKDTTLNVLIEQTNNPEVGTDDMAGWLLVVEQSKADLADIKTYDAQYVGIKEDEAPKQLPGHIVYGSFSFEEVKSSIDMSAPNVKTDGFVNVDEIEMGWPTDRAKLEVAADYDLAQLYYDDAADVWQVYFFSSKPSGGDETVYLNGKGVTLLIVYGE